MVIFSYLIIAILSIISIVLAVAAFVKKGYSVQREIVILKNAVEVFDYIKHLENQPKYSAWAQMDNNMKQEFIGTDGEVGFTYKWEGNKKVGQGVQKITAVQYGEFVEFEINFIKPFEGFAISKMSTASIGEAQTRVTWSLKSAMKYPMNIMLLFMDMDKMIGKDFEIGLNNLKKELSA